MRVIKGMDVNELYWRGMNLLHTEGRKEDSRVGPVLVMPEPVCSVYENPTQRVLLDIKRACNPFFHLFESLWMLAGRDDVEALNTYITDFGTRFSEPDGKVHGAYGHRWRYALGFDQLDAIVTRLRNNPQDRQAVLQMWNAVPFVRDRDGNMAESSNDLLGNWKDRPCNTQVYFRVRDTAKPHYSSMEGTKTKDHEVPGEKVLDMMITCRSNDIVFGAYGANAVHFSILQEYMAGRIGVAVGRMEQVSFNYHAYVDVLSKFGVPSYLETYTGHELKSKPMAKDWAMFDGDLTRFMLWQRGLVQRGETATKHDYVNTWFRHTAEPMFLAHWQWKSAMKDEARKTAQMIEAKDWRYAVLQWFDIRTEARSR